MQGNPREIGNDDVARDFVAPVVSLAKLADVVERLRFGFAEVFAERLVFDQQDARPEKVNVAVVAGDFLHRLFKAGDDAAFDAEDLKEFVPEGLFFGALAFDARPFAGELDRVVADFVPRDRHGGGVCADKLSASMTLTT